MFKRRNVITLFSAVAFLSSPAFAQDALAQDAKPLDVVASFSILGDFVAQVGGSRVQVHTLVGPNGDAHVFQPSPADAKTVANASIIFVNGLGFEGWIERLVQASGTRVKPVVATQGIKARIRTKDEPQDDDEEGDTHKAGHDHGPIDPHAWQSVANAKVYVANIRDTLDKADPAGKADYDANASAYLARLDALDKKVKATIDALPANHKRIITSHDAFGYFGDAYGVKLVAPQGVSTETEASAKDVAAIVRQIKAQKIPAVFMENISDPRLVERIGAETGAKIGGTLYSDALSDSSGPAKTYVDMVEHNIEELGSALSN